MREDAAAMLRMSPLVRKAVMRLRFGDLKRTEPLSEWGFERGLPVDRWYIHRYLESQSQAVGGHALEVQEDVYSSRFGAHHVDIVDIDPANTRANIIGDLCTSDTLERNRYDVIILTQTLQLLTDPAAALSGSLSALRPGGSLLLTAPTTSRLAATEDRWRWTPRGMRTLLDSLVPPSAHVEVMGMGNMLSSRAFLFGMAAEELGTSVLAMSDHRYPLLVGAHVTLATARES